MTKKQTAQMVARIYDVLTDYGFLELDETTGDNGEVVWRIYDKKKGSFLTYNTDKQRLE
jgi:hypothetical protein